MRPLVSVIVPVYKVEDCLIRCLDSLCRQRLSDIEILLIDDASPDQCGNICDAFAQKDIRFRVFHNKLNRGLSVARNIGIKNANSDYLMFVDSDDWVHEDFCKEAYECAVRFQADLVMFRFQSVRSFGCFEWKCTNAKRFTQDGIKTRLEAMELLETSHNGVGSAAWNKLYRKELFHDISYPPGYFHEDTGTTYKIIWQANRIYYLDKALYYHCFRPGSITTLKTEKSLSDWNEMITKQYRDLTDWGYPPEKLDILLKNIALLYCIKKKFDNTDDNYVFYSKVLLDSKTIPVNFRWEKKVLFVLFKYCRPLFESICFLFDLKIY